MMSKKTLLLFKKPVLIVMLLFFNQVFSQQEQEIDTTFSKDSKTFLVVPLISNSPVMETGFGGLAMYFFKVNKEDTISPPSLMSVYGIYTTNKSHIIAPFGRFFWNEDKNKNGQLDAGEDLNGDGFLNYSDDDLSNFWKGTRGDQ